MVGSSASVIFYLATPPETFSDIVAALALCGLAKKADPTRRIGSQRSSPSTRGEHG